MNNVKFIEDITNCGYEIESIWHNRLTVDGHFIPYSRKRPGTDSRRILPYGGMTVAQVEINNGTPYTADGVSRCSIDDNFCYKVGTRIALCRAVWNLSHQAYMKDNAAQASGARVHIYCCGPYSRHTPAFILIPGAWSLICDDYESALRACHAHSWVPEYSEVEERALDLCVPGAVRVHAEAHT